MNASSPQSPGIAVEVRGLKKSFRGDTVLHGVEFTVKSGERFVIMGPSGSGKSVCLRHIIGLETPDAGEVRLNGEPLSETVRNRLRMAMVFQSGGLLNSLTVEENLGLYHSEHQLKTPAEIETLVQQKLALVELDPEVADRYPSELSGGMRKRVAIARALVVEPQLILYDEPTSELDPLVARTIAREIVNLNRRTGATSVVVTHDRDLAFGIADRIAFLHEGRILDLGTPEELRRTTDPLIREFLTAEFRPTP
jgi:phospholipid/cholesterol/gamma-HCH transport system ATP-binding protein